MSCWKQYGGCTCDVLPAGTYYIGDPCYALGDPNIHWQRICNVMFDNTNNVSAQWNKDKLETGSIAQKSLENFGLQISKHTNNKKMNALNRKFYDVAIFGTGGDGQFTDMKSSNSYAVDAGIIGAIPAQIITKNKKTREKDEWFINGGNFETFKDAVHCYTDGRYLHFGNSDKHIAIDTNCEPIVYNEEGESSQEEMMENW